MRGLTRYNHRGCDLPATPSPQGGRPGSLSVRLSVRPTWQCRTAEQPEARAQCRHESELAGRGGALVRGVGPRPGLPRQELRPSRSLRDLKPLVTRTRIESGSFHHECRRSPATPSRRPGPGHGGGGGPHAAIIISCVHLWNSHEMVAAQLHERPLKPEESQQTEKASRLWWHSWMATCLK